MAEFITPEDAQYALDIVKKICTEIGPDKPGSLQEQERAAVIKREKGYPVHLKSFIEEETIP